MAKGQFEKAIPLYQQLVKAVPGNPGLVLNLALAEHMAGYEREAIPHFETILKSQPNLVPALVSLGEARLALNEPQQAAEQFRKASSFSPDDPGIWYNLGSSYQAIAVAVFDHLQKLNPQSPYVSALVADTRVQRRQYRSAFFFYQQTLKQLPNLHGIHTALAEVYRKTGHTDWAVDEESKDRALPAPDCAAHPAECQFVAGHDLKAIEVPANSSSPEALYWQAKAANELALQAFFRLGQLPPSVELFRLQAEIARNRGEHSESVQQWRAALQLAPGNPRLERELAASLFMAADYQGALDQATKLLKNDPRSPELNFITGDSLLHLENADKAVPYLEAALAADPKLLAADASLGLALSRLGKSAEAVPHLEKSLELDDDGSLHYQLARAYQAAGDREKARAAMEQYQQIVKRNEEQKAEVAREAEIAPPR